jgi:BirA family transcriptional regulator, biotin operon repressor / biotin---[acetyl-CoA-carboxylase] ligase
MRPALAELLAARGPAWPAPLEHLPEAASTNDLLKARAREGAPEWSVVVADRQTAGRGRQGRAWASPPGNLFLSVLVRPRFAEVTVLPLAAGLAVAEALPELEARLKWPNDVVVGGRKLAGVLAEAQSGPAGVESVVVGIGVNVGLAREDLPAELRESATSWRMETGAGRDPLEVGAAVLARLRVWYHALAAGDSAAVVAAWRGRSVPWWGREVVARGSGQDLRGIARGISGSGALLVETADGSLQEILAGDVHEVRAP